MSYRSPVRNSLPGLFVCLFFRASTSTHYKNDYIAIITECKSFLFKNKQATHTHTHTRARARTHARTHTHTHTQTVAADCLVTFSLTINERLKWLSSSLPTQSGVILVVAVNMVLNVHRNRGGRLVNV